MEVNAIERPSKVNRSEKQLIMFSQEDEAEVIYPHDDPLQLNIGVDRLRPVQLSLIGFSGKPVQPKGRIALPVTLGEEDKSTYPNPEMPEKNEPQPWLFLIDGSKTKEANGAGIVLQSPDGTKLKYALRFQFNATNNQAEYEALITGIQLAKAMGTKCLAVISDSQLIIGQVNGEHEAKEESIGKYLNLVKKLAKSFEKFCISQVPREENLEEYQVARLVTVKDELIPRDVMMQYLKNPSIAQPIVEVKMVEYA
ncbi:hypothetical protein Vadar_003985 [Vaccinium darrowii]|uniref:Uncharacterized protein n=1 Tax=Vaccinium darrowii TaxID=229202 RepID=A0ACB7YTT8_9ERIC|nr:hypothetical protein Vadar_003985 [Vaccinium darrowii]